MRTAENRVQKHILCYNNSIRHWSYHQFNWYAGPASKLSWAFGISLRTVNNPFLIWCYTHRDAPFVFNIWWLLCSLSVQHGCLLFFKFTLKSGVLLVQEFSVSIIARFLHVGKTFVKKISRIYRYRNTVPPQLISHQGQMDGWWKNTKVN